jgi:hypothetical protein
MNHRRINSGNRVRVSGVLDDASVVLRELNRDLGKYVMELKRVREEASVSGNSNDSLRESQRRVEELRGFLRKKGLVMAKREASVLGIGKKTARQLGLEAGKCNLAGEFEKMRAVLREYMKEYSVNDKKAVNDFRAGYLEGSQHRNMQDIASKLIQMARELLGDDDKEKQRKKR